MVRTGTLADATLLPSASIRTDGEARWAGHRLRKPAHGYKARVATDEGAGLVRGVEVTAATVHDAAELAPVLFPEPGDVYADNAFTGGRAERAIIGRGGRPRTMWPGIWGRGPEALERLEAHDAAVRRARCRIEKVFGTLKRSYGLRRMCWRGLAKAGPQVRLAAIAYNLRRSWRLLAPKGSPSPTARLAHQRAGQSPAIANTGAGEHNRLEKRRSPARRRHPRTVLIIPPPVPKRGRVVTGRGPARPCSDGRQIAWRARC